MNKLVHFSIFLVFTAVFLTLAVGNDPLVDKTLDGVAKVANKSAEYVDNKSKTAKENLQRFAHPEPHQPGKTNIFSSAVRGAGRLLRNMTVEAGRFVGVVGKGVFNLTKNAVGASTQTLKESVNRLSGNFTTPPGKETTTDTTIKE